MIETAPCDVCGDPVTFDPAAEWDGEDGHEPYVPVCTCCYGVICDKHTASVTCPHKPADHDLAAAETLSSHLFRESAIVPDTCGTCGRHPDWPGHRTTLAAADPAPSAESTEAPG